MPHNNKDDRIIRFDWAAKRFLCNEANSGIPEGFFTVLLDEKITIIEMLESEGNRIHADDKLNRVDIKARNSKDEIVIIEIQNTREAWYWERILYGVAKIITEHISLGDRYDNVKKVYSINILYFDLGRGIDLNLTQGSEIPKVRPCVVISPVTSTLRNYPFRIRCMPANKTGEIVTDQYVP